MKRSRYSDEQIAYVLRQVESGTPVADVVPPDRYQRSNILCWKKKYANLGATEMKELRQLREENSKLKSLVADLTLDKHILGEIIRKNLKPVRRRELVDWVRTAYRASLGRACRLVQISRSLFSYRSRRADQRGLRM